MDLTKASSYRTTKETKAALKHIFEMHRSLTHLYNHFANQHPLHVITNRRVLENSFGYYISDLYLNELQEIYKFFKIIKTLEVFKKPTIRIGDLGCGAGIFIKTLSKISELVYEHSILYGFERERHLIHTCSTLIGGINVYERDLLHLTKEDIKDIDILYAYEPIKDAVKCEQFLQNLVNIMNHNQLFLYRSAGILSKEKFKKLSLEKVSTNLNLQFQVYRKVI